MGTFADYSWIKSRLGFSRLRDLLADQLTDVNLNDSEADAELDVYVEDEIIDHIDSLVNSAIARQISLPIATTNPQFGLLQGIARRLLIREVYAHAKFNDVPPKIENNYIVANQQIRMLTLGQLTITQDDSDGPESAGTIAVGGDESTVEILWDTDLNSVW